MPRSLIRYILPLVMVVGMLLSLKWPVMLLWVFGSVVLVSLLVFKVWLRRSFRREWNLWLNYILFSASSLMQLSIIERPHWQGLYVAFICAIWVWVSYSLSRYFANPIHVASKKYLDINRFVYFLTLWQVLNFVYFAMLFIGLSLFFGFAATMLIVFFLSRHTIFFEDIRKSSRFLILVALLLTSAELFVALNLLPIHFYIQSALLTLWFFFVIELTIRGQDVSSRKRLFWRYGLFFAFVAILLIATSYIS